MQISASRFIEEKYLRNKSAVCRYSFFVKWSFWKQIKILEHIIYDISFPKFILLEQNFVLKSSDFSHVEFKPLKFYEL